MIDDCPTNPELGDQLVAFLNRPGTYYTVDVIVHNSTTGAPRMIQFGIKADDNQLPYAKEILQQLRGAIGGDVTLRPMTPVYDRLPGTTEAYAKRPPEAAPEYIGKHRAPDAGDYAFPETWPPGDDGTDLANIYEGHLDDVAAAQRAINRQAVTGEIKVDVRPHEDNQHHLDNLRRAREQSILRDGRHAATGFDSAGTPRKLSGEDGRHGAYTESDFDFYAPDDRDYSHIFDPDA